MHFIFILFFVKNARKLFLDFWTFGNKNKYLRIEYFIYSKVGFKYLDHRRDHHIFNNCQISNMKLEFLIFGLGKNEDYFLKLLEIFDEVTKDFTMVIFQTYAHISIQSKLKKCFHSPSELSNNNTKQIY